MDVIAHRKSYTRGEFLKKYFTDMFVTLAQVSVYLECELEQVASATRQGNKKQNG